MTSHFCGPATVRAVLGAVVALAVLVACESTPVPVPTGAPDGLPTPTPLASPSAEGPPSAAPTTTDIATAASSPAATPVSTSASVSPTPFAPSVIVTSDDRLLTIGVPEGAVPDGVTLSATALGVSDLPPELLGLEVRSAFYEIAPPDVEFTSPVQVTRRVSYRALGLDPETDGTPVLSLALRASDGSWKWLDSQRLATDGQFVTVSGWATQTGTVFAFGGSTFVVLDWSDPDFALPVGGAATLTVSMTFPSGMTDPPSLSPLSAHADGDSVTLGSTSSGPDGTSYGQEFRCTADGQSAVAATSTVGNIGADSVLFQSLGLVPVAVDLLADATLTCGTAPTPTVSAPPS